MVDTARTCLFALALLACGGKSSQIGAISGDDDAGGSSPSRGGRSGSTGAGGSVATGGNPVGGSAGTAGSSGALGDGCEPNTVTSIVGTVRDPSGRMPLYNVVVYVPLEPLPEMPIGTSCDVCALYLPE